MGELENGRNSLTNAKYDNKRNLSSETLEFSATLEEKFYVCHCLAVQNILHVCSRESEAAEMFQKKNINT